MAVQVRFINGRVLFRSGFGTFDPYAVAMGELCCCEGSVAYPEHGIFARDCCTGDELTGYFLDLNAPPEWAFTKVFWDPVSSKCFKFDVGDIGTAPRLDSGVFDAAIDFLAASYDQYAGCNACRCDHTQAKCCYDYESYPDATSRAGFLHYQFAGLSVDPLVYTCREISPGAGIYAQTDTITLPTGPYTWTTDGSIDGEGNQVFEPFTVPNCEVELQPAFTATTRYFTDPACTTPSGYNGGVYTEFLDVSDGSVGLIEAATGTGLTGKIFSAITTPYDYCEPVTTSNANVGGTDLGSTGSVTVFPCCPEEPGGI